MSLPKVLDSVTATALLWDGSPIARDPRNILGGTLGTKFGHDWGFEPQIGLG